MTKLARKNEQALKNFFGRKISMKFMFSPPRYESVNDDDYGEEDEAEDKVGGRGGREGGRRHVLSASYRQFK